MLENLLGAGGELHCVDHWQGGYEHDQKVMPEVEARFDRNIARAQARTQGAEVHGKLKAGLEPHGVRGAGSSKATPARSTSSMWMAGTRRPTCSPT